MSIARERRFGEYPLPVKPGVTLPGESSFTDLVMKLM